MSIVPHHAVDGPADAPVLLLANSLGSTMAMWEPQLPRLTAAGLRVVRFDTRGHGGSPAPAGPYTLADLGGDVLALLDQLGVRQAHFCGLSLGGMVGMWLAAHAPERIDRLVLCCTSARLGPAHAWTERARTVRERGTAAVADAVVGRWFTPGYAARQPAQVATARAMIAGTPAEGYAGCCAAIAAMNLVPELPRVTAPTLVIAGADDPATPPSHAETIARGIPGARLAVLPDAAHLANVEQPEAVTELILAHLVDATLTTRKEPT